MSFLSRIKELGKSHDDDEVQPEALSTEGMVTASGAQNVDTRSAASTIQPGGGRTTTADSIISESAPSEFPVDYHDTRMKLEQEDGAVPETQSGLPLIGHLRLDRQQRMLGGALVVGVLGLMGAAFLAVTSADRRAVQTGATGQALMQSQRLAKSVSQALIGRSDAFDEVADSAQVLATNVRGLAQGDSKMGLSEVSGAAKEALTPDLLRRVDSAEKNAKYVLAQKKTLTQVSQALREVNAQSSELLDLAEGIATTKIEKGGVPPAEATSLNQMVMLTQRIGKSANEFLTVEGVSTEAVFLLGKDLNAFKEIAEGLLNGNQELRLAASHDPAVREQLDALLKIFERTRTQSTFILGSLQGLVAARDAQVAVINDSEPLRKGLETVQSKLSEGAGIGAIGLVISAFLAINAADRRATQAGATGQALMQSQRLAKSVSQALIGRAPAFVEVAESSKVLASNLRGLAQGDSALGISEVPASAKEVLKPLLPLVDRAEKNANFVLKQKEILTKVSQSLREVNSHSSDLLDLAEGIATTKIEKGGVSNAELTALNQLVMLTQRIGKSANEFLTVEGVSTEAVFLLGKDLNAFKELAEGLTNGSKELQLPGTQRPRGA